MIKLSSYVKQLWMSDYGLKNIFMHGVIDIYTGTQPSSPDSAFTGTLLGKVTQNGAVFTPGSRTAGALILQQTGYGVLSNYGNWNLTVTTSGDAGWFRFKGNYTDNGLDDTSRTFIRMDGAVNSDSELLLLNTTLTSGITLPVQFYLQFRNL